jgi:TPR repeat protein
LGVCYKYGEGVTKNLETAASWYKKAAEQGDTDAQKMVKKIALQKMSRTEQLKTLEKGDIINGTSINQWHYGSSEATIRGKVIEWNAYKTEVLIEIISASTYIEDDR